MEFNFRSIGRVKSCFPDKFGVPRQPRLVPSSWAEIILEPWTHPLESLDGLEDFSHAWIIFVFHKNSGPYTKPKIHPPRLDGEKTGVFASRSPHRFNPIGMSVVKIEKIDDKKIFVSGVDLVDGTPILDIKPYVPTGDLVIEATSSWTVDKPNDQLKVIWDQQALEKLAKMRVSDKFKSIVEECLSLDPRAIAYKAKGDVDQPYGNDYGMNIENCNVVFTVTESIATVKDLQRLHTSQKNGTK